MAQEASAYRTNEREDAEAVSDAYYDLLAQVRVLRSRAMSYGGLAAGAAGCAGAFAHARGYWSIFGASSDGTYVVGVATIGIGFVLLAAPFAAMATLFYRWQLRGVIRRWTAHSIEKYGLTRDVLVERALRRL